MIPSKIKIGASTWEVVYSDQLDIQCLGRCDYPEHRIILDVNLSEQAREENFVHELLHACATQVGINGDKLTEEEFVNRISYTLYAVLKENGCFFTAE